MTDCVSISGGDLSAVVMCHGAVLADLRIKGVAHGLTLSLPSLDAYQADKSHVGAIAGPVAGRIAGGRFSIDGTEYISTRNDGPNTLHGGDRGFGRRPWQLLDKGPDFVLLALHWPDQEEGFPGPIDATCRYSIKGNALTITLEAVTARPTLCNLAQHSYFNLAGEGRIDDHILQMATNRITPLGADLLPTGEIASAPNALDFSTPRKIGGTVLDNSFVLSSQRRPTAFAARLSTESLAMTLRTTEPGLIVYTADKLQSVDHQPRHGICLEPQCWPDAVNHPSFPSIVLRPENRYRQETILEFQVL